MSDMELTTTENDFEIDEELEAIENLTDADIDDGDDAVAAETVTA